MSKRKTWAGRIYLGRDANGTQQFHWVGRFPTRRERDAAVAAARQAREWETSPSFLTCDDWADRYLTRHERQYKASSTGTARQTLKAFRREFGDRTLASITPVEAEDWAHTVPRSNLPQVVAMFNYAVRMDVIARNPFAGLGGGRGRGRADAPPPTLEELERLRDACLVLGDSGPRFRDLIDFAAYTLMRPGELFELRYDDIDLRRNRIEKRRRLYRGRVDEPKTGVKTIALVPPARDIVLRQPTRTREDGLVFVSMAGRQLTAPTVSQYWARVRARAGLDFAFYSATKHYGVHRLYVLGLSARAIAAQAGWSEREADAMLRVYGHADLVALEEVDALYASVGGAKTEERIEP